MIKRGIDEAMQIGKVRGRFRLLFLLVPIVTAFAAFAVVWADENGPETTDDIGDGYGTSHTSTVYYTRQLSPFIAWVDRVYFGGRKPDDSFPGQCCGAWRVKKTLYREWDGSEWDTVVNEGAGSWHEPAGAPELSYYNMNRDVTLEGGALVQQKLEFRKIVTVLEEGGMLQYSGRWHSHFLE